MNKDKLPVIFNVLNNVRSHTQEDIGDCVESKDKTCSFSVLPDEPGLENISYYAVFDGHFSPAISDYLSKELLKSILNADFVLFNALAEKMLKLNSNTVVKRIKEAIRQGFLDIDQKMRDLPEIKNREQNDSGSTAIVSLITPTHIFIANCGNSRAILVSDNRLTFVSKDHLLTSPNEEDRIKKAGGILETDDQRQFVRAFELSNKNFIKLYVSRALGDFSFKSNPNREQCEQIISPEPDIEVHERSTKDEFLLLANDAVWNVILNEQMKTCVQKYLNSFGSELNHVTDSIIVKCLSKADCQLRQDNMSIILITFPNESKALKENKEQNFKTNKVQNDKFGSNFYSKQGEHYFNTQNYLKAIESFNKTIEKKPNYSYFHFMKGNALYKLNRYTEAIICYDDAISNYETEFECKLKKFCLVPICDSNHAINNLFSVEAFYFMKGKALLHVKKYDESVFCFEKVLETKPNKPSYHFMLGKALYLSCLYYLAASSFKKAIRLNPRDSDYYYMYGMCYYETVKRQNNMSSRQLNHIIESLNKSIKLKPYDSNTYAAKGKVFYLFKKFNEAIKCSTQAIKLSPTEGFFYLFRGKIHMKINDWTEAVEDFRVALNLNPDNKECADCLQESLRHLNGHKILNYRTVVIASDLPKKFLKAADINTLNNVETCGVLAGKLNGNIFTITHCILPKQSGTSDTCTTEQEHELVDTMFEHNLITLGWIHTHPTQTAFLSSIDMHTHYGYQMQIPEAIAIVCAPSYDDIKYFTLTSPNGMNEIGECSISNSLFHKHSEYLFKQCKHVREDANVKAKIIDLRKI